MAEALTVFLTVEDPLGQAMENAVEEAFDDLEVRPGGIGEVVGWDAAADGLQLHLMAVEPERVIAVLTEHSTRSMSSHPPNWWRAIRRAARACMNARSRESATDGSG